MAAQDIFGEDVSTSRLASYFEELYEYLLEQGVPEECLPSPWHVLRRVTKAIDHELIHEWLDAYSAVEGELEDEAENDDEDGIPVHDGEAQPRPRTRPRPSYLRALETEAPSDEQESDDANSVAEEAASSDDT